MTRSFSVVFVAVLLVSALAGGAVAQSDGGDDLFRSLEEMVPAYNENADAVDLGPINLAGTTNVYVRDGDAERAYSITMDEQNRITALDDGRSDDAVRKITTDRSTLDGIAAAENPAAAFRTAVANDDIAISGEGGRLLEGVKWAIINRLKGFFL
ncbi:hypothetical protein C464_07215 [Halorubrum coriense DSM 10284]|uniref:SCP2 domain-containing protein n=1 Tax=Halorubrum coriense DSM 10284 TaxID=1227466 RepID=M0EL47_9EURY|nr:hypothetical protein [Halorubrum coriense]ELZ48470.1 hypothetical protein C464_07215 [Halorubrum coriense DSM 10284]